MTARSVLFELGTEELPTQAQLTLPDILADQVRANLETAELTFEPAIQAYASSRRLALLIPQVAAQTPEREETRRGPSVQAAFDAEGEPTPALRGFMKGCQASEDQLARWQQGQDCIETSAGKWVAFTRTRAPQNCQELLPQIFAQALRDLPLPKRMRWGAQDLSFLRPVRWVVLMYGDEVVEGQLMGLPCGRTSQGHRALSDGQISFNQAEDYVETLSRQGQVLIDADARAQNISEQIAILEKQLGHTAEASETLLDEVCAGVEFPVVLAGHLDSSFAGLPEAVVLEVLEGQQKYLPMRDSEGALAKHFLVVANVPDPENRIRRGAEAVVRARLHDAAFYLQHDRQRPFASRVEDLAGVAFHHKLGTMHERAERLVALSRHLAQRLGEDLDLAAQAARLCKADLGTDIVQSFPKLQGVMGAHYARLEEEPEAVCTAIAEHYQPRHAGDALPQTPLGQILALADRLDMLAGISNIDEMPTGTRDPLGIRRASYGILRLMVEGPMGLDLDDELEAAAQNYPENLRNAAAVPTAHAYMYERLSAYCAEQGQAKDAIRAVLEAPSTPARPIDILARITAVSAFKQLPQARTLIETSRRLHNILEAAGEIPDATSLDPALMEPVETALQTQLEDAKAQMNQHYQQQNYPSALEALCALAEPIDAFFEEVLVMAEDARIRHNRLGLLQELQQLFTTIADFTVLQVRKEEAA